MRLSLNMEAAAVAGHSQKKTTSPSWRHLAAGCLLFIYQHHQRKQRHTSWLPYHTPLFFPNTQSSRVDVSPSSKPRLRATKRRRMILPDRVLGSASTNSTSAGWAIGPRSSRT